MNRISNLVLMSFTVKEFFIVCCVLYVFLIRNIKIPTRNVIVMVSTSVSRCNSCPGTDKLRDYLMELFSEEDYDPDDTVTYKQWVDTDRTTLISVEHEVHEFKDLVVRSYDELRKHQYIMKSQSADLRELKDSVRLHTAVILPDFDENYSFLVQDAVQGRTGAIVRQLYILLSSIINKMES